MKLEELIKEYKKSIKANHMADEDYTAYTEEIDSALTLDEFITTVSFWAVPIKDESVEHIILRRMLE